MVRVFPSSAQLEKERAEASIRKHGYTLHIPLSLLKTEHKTGSFPGLEVVVIESYQQFDQLHPHTVFLGIRWTGLWSPRGMQNGSLVTKEREAFMERVGSQAESEGK